MKKDSIDVIFTGLIRTPDWFKKSLEYMLKFRKKKLISKIIFSTWDYELAKYPGLKEFLLKNKIIIIENKEPEDRGRGNIFCQMKSLEVGLKKVNKNKFVLKTRCDLFINPDFLEDLIVAKEEKLRITYHLPKKDLFKYKVWVPYFEITAPFHIADECFFGYYNDISKLVNYEHYDDDYKIKGGAAHVQRYMPVFISDYPILENYLINHSNVGFSADTKTYRFFKKMTSNSQFLTNLFNKFMVNIRFMTLKKRFKEEGYMKALAAYYFILYSHFYIDNSGIDNDFNNNDIFNRNIKPKKLVGDKKLINNYSKYYIFVPSKGHIYSLNNKFLKLIFEGKLEDHKFSNKLLNEISGFGLKS